MNLRWSVGWLVDHHRHVRRLPRSLAVAQRPRSLARSGRVGLQVRMHHLASSEPRFRTLGSCSPLHHFLRNSLWCHLAVEIDRRADPDPRHSRKWAAMSMRIAGPKPGDLSHMGEHCTVQHCATHVLHVLLGPDRISNALFAWQRSGGGAWWGAVGGVGAIVPLSVLITGLGTNKNPTGIEMGQLRLLPHHRDHNR